MDLRHRLRPPAAAAYLGLSSSTLAKMRLRGGGPPYSHFTVTAQGGLHMRLLLYRVPEPRAVLLAVPLHAVEEARRRWVLTSLGRRSKIGASRPACRWPKRLRSSPCSPPVWTASKETGLCPRLH